MLKKKYLMNDNTMAEIDVDQDSRGDIIDTLSNSKALTNYANRNGLSAEEYRNFVNKVADKIVQNKYLFIDGYNDINKEVKYIKERKLQRRAYNIDTLIDSVEFDQKFKNRAESEGLLDYISGATEGGSLHRQSLYSVQIAKRNAGDMFKVNDFLKRSKMNYLLKKNPIKISTLEQDSVIQDIIGQLNKVVFHTFGVSNAQIGVQLSVSVEQFNERLKELGLYNSRDRASLISTIIFNSK